MWQKPVSARTGLFKPLMAETCQPCFVAE